MFPLNDFTSWSEDTNMKILVEVWRQLLASYDTVLLTESMNHNQHTAQRSNTHVYTTV
jgi:hypothetical protein